MDTLVPNNPYVGPRAIKAGEAFFGRDREIRSLSALLVAERIVLLHSPSGAGKSSLIQAGLAPRMAERFKVFPPVRLNLEPPGEALDSPGLNRYTLSTLVSLEEGLPAEKRIPMRELAGLSLEAYLDQHEQAETSQENCLLIFDQFEEILTISPTDAPVKQAFFEQLGEALQNRHRWALFAIREDYLGGLNPYVRAIPNRLSVTFRLGLLGPEAARLAIQQPARNVGVVFTDDSAEKLVDDLRRIQVQQADGSFATEAGPSIEPVQLQVVCFNLWQAQAADDNVIDEDDLKRVGSVDQALASFYANAVQSVAESSSLDERKLRRWFDEFLITPEGIRSQVLKGAESTEGLPNATLRLLENTHLIRGESRAGKTWYELSHDRLVAPVRQDNAAWFEKNLNLLQRGAVYWDQQGRSDEWLLPGKVLEQAERESKNVQLSADEQDFLKASQKLRAQQKLRRTALIGLAGFSILTLGLLIFVLVQLNISRAQQLGFQAEAAFAEKNFNAAALFAFQSNQIHENNAADLILRKLPYEKFGIATGLEGQNGPILSLDWSPNGRLASASPSRIVIWDVAKDQPEIIIDQPGTSCVAWSHDGRLASCEGQKVIIWDLATRQPAQTLEGHNEQVNALAWSPDGRLASASDDNTIIIWDLKSNQPAQVLKGHSEGVLSVAWSVDNTLASGSRDYTVIIWDLKTGTPAEVLKGHKDDVQAVAWSESNLLASGSSDNNIIVWTYESGQPTQILNTLEGHEEGVMGLAWSKDRLASASRDGSLIIWDVSKGLPVETLRGHGASVNSVAWSPAGRLASGSDDARILLWTLQTASPAAKLEEHAGPVNSLAWSPDDRLLASASSDRTVIIWDLVTGRHDFIVGSKTGALNSIAWSYVGKLATGSSDKTVVVWYSESIQERTLTGHTDKVLQVAWSPDERLASASADKTIIIWNLATGKPGLILKDTDTPVSMAWSPDGRQLAAVSGINIIIWDATTGQIIRKLQGHKDPITSLAWSADGRIASASTNAANEAALIIWDGNSGNQLTSFRADRGVIDSLAWSVDGKLASAHASNPNLNENDNEVVVWNIPDRTGFVSISPHRGSVRSVAWSSDGLLASASDDKSISVVRPDILISYPCDWINRNMTVEEWLDYQGPLYVYRKACPEFYDPTTNEWMDPIKRIFGGYIYNFQDLLNLLITWKGRFVIFGLLLIACALMALIIWIPIKIIARYRARKMKAQA